MNQKILFLLLSTIGILKSCSQSVNNKPSGDLISELQFELLDIHVVPYKLNVDSTVVGGLSSIDWMYDNLYITISDDRSEFNSARAYPIKIYQSNNQIDSVKFSSPIFLKKPDGSLFELDAVDPEAIRYNAAANSYLFSSEGGRQEDIQHPFVQEIDLMGNYLRSFAVPEIFKFNENSGTRTNGGFENLTIENDTIIWYANELPLKQDGVVPTFEKGYSPIRLVRHDTKNDKVLNQYIYNIDPVFAKPNDENAFYINSVPEILYVKPDELWIMERAYVAGIGNSIKLFRVNTENAIDVNLKISLANIEHTQLKKELLLDFSNFDQKPDNIEGITFGPKLSDGRHSVYFISDDNFNEQQKTQIWLFAVSGLATKD